MKTRKGSWAKDKQTGNGSQPQTHPVTVDKDAARRPQVKGKFFFVGDEKLYIRGVTYGTFRPDESGDEFHNPEVVEKDFAQMTTNGINVVRIYTPPPIWLLDMALQKGLYVMVGLPWEQHVTFLESRKTARRIEDRVRTMIRGISGHPALFCYVIGNEIPSSIVRWHGRRKIERYLKRLYFIAKKEDPEGLVTYVNFPTTEYLQLPFLDFHCFNVYLEEQDRLESYLNRLQNITGDLPLVMGEIGLDSRRNGEEKQAEVLDWQIRTAFRAGCEGTFVFSWTDEWYRGGYDIEDWDFGLTDRNRRPKAALGAVRKAYAEVPFPNDMSWPRISVVVCSYNGAGTIGRCYDAVKNLDYPNFELIVVNDGSTDTTADITKRNGFRMIETHNVGLSAARNLGLEAATGDIVAYIDDDAYPDRDWLKYLAATFLSSDHAGVGGPNIPPPDDGEIAACVANSPGGPQHVLVSDQEAEHIPGCNMAFRKEHLKAVGGFDPQFRAAGDDVDVCWKMSQRGWRLGFNPAAMVWHHRRNSVRAYFRQQKGYGKAEAFLERKWPEKYNDIGHTTWNGKIYGNGHTKSFTWKKKRIYHGTWNCSPFQSLYSPKTNTLASLPLTPEWYLLSFMLLGMSFLGLLWKPLLMALPLFGIMFGSSLLSVIKSVSEVPGVYNKTHLFKGLKFRLITGLLHMTQPLARLYGRLRHGLTPFRMRCVHDFKFPRPRSSVIWDETWKSQEKRLAAIETALRSSCAIVTRGGDFDSWDLEVRGGFFTAVRMRMAIEEHGAGKQLVRLRSWPRLSITGSTAVFFFAVMSFLAATDHAWVVSGVFAAIAGLVGVKMFQAFAAATASYLQAVKTIDWNKLDDYRDAIEPDNKVQKLGEPDESGNGDGKNRSCRIDVAAVGDRSGAEERRPRNNASV